MTQVAWVSESEGKQFEFQNHVQCNRDGFVSLHTKLNTLINKIKYNNKLNLYILQSLHTKFLNGLRNNGQFLFTGTLFGIAIYFSPTDDNLGELMSTVCGVHVRG